MLIKNWFFPIAFTIFMQSSAAWAQMEFAAPAPLQADPELDEILSRDIAELTVTTASKRSQRLSDVPAAISVLTQEDIRRSGATSIPEALRMVPGIEVARLASNQWAVTARGFNDATANKLLVMIDGRSIYTPIFSGTYWDDQSTLLADIERIEVIRGPGASLWGANAVNGIINIITKHTSNTIGNYAAGGLGTEEEFAEARHGGKIDADTTYRTYARYGNLEASKLRTGGDTTDAWYRARSGFRMDKSLSSQDSLTLSGDAYGGEQDSSRRINIPTAPYFTLSAGEDSSYGGDVQLSWNRKLSETDNLQLQGYIDHYSRIESYAKQHISRVDLEFQHNTALNNRNNFIWGGGARLNIFNLENTFTASFAEGNETHQILSAFLQDEYALLPDSLYLTIGSKFEHNDYTGFEVQPSARIAWHPTEDQTIWGAVSRAVRTPSGYENNVTLIGIVTPGSPPTALSAQGSSELDSETVISSEVGYRTQLTPKLSVDAAAFYNQYDKLVTFSFPTTSFLRDGVLISPYMASNLGEGDVYGGELSSNWNISDAWRLVGSYTYLEMYLDSKVPVASNLENVEENVPQQQFSLRSYWNLSDTWEWDNMLYYVDSIRTADDYLRYDTRLGWNILPTVNLSIIGQNLLDSTHPEYGLTTEIERSFLARLTFKF